MLYRLVIFYDCFLIFCCVQSSLQSRALKFHFTQSAVATLVPPKLGQLASLGRTKSDLCHLLPGGKLLPLRGKRYHAQAQLH